MWGELLSSVKGFYPQNKCAKQIKQIKQIAVAMLPIIITVGAAVAMFSLVFFWGLPTHQIIDVHIHRRVTPVNSTTLPVDTSAWPKGDLTVYVGYGQSNSDCCAQRATETPDYEDIYQYAYNNTYPYSDPMVGAYCDGGCVYGYLGRALRSGRRGGATARHVFATAGVPGATLEALTNTRKHPYQYLVATYNTMLSRFQRVDGILFHQGESDAHTAYGHATYENTFVSFVKNLRADLNGPFTIFLAQATLCKTLEADVVLSQIQANLANNADLPEVVLGPNTDVINGAQWRYDGCHFSVDGAQRVAEAWKSVLR